MRFGPDDKFWVVCDPSIQSELGDILFEASLRDLELQFRGGLTANQNPTIFTSREEAEVEAKCRLAARRVFQLISRRNVSLEDASQLMIMNTKGKVVLAVDIERGELW